MNATALAAAGDRSLTETWARLAHAGGWEVDDQRSAICVCSGLPIAALNGVFLRNAVQADEADSIVARAVEFFDSQAVPWLLWTRQGTDPVISSACERAGLREVGGPPGMILPTIPSATPQPADGVEITRAQDDDVDALRTILSRGFDMPLEVAAVMMGPEILATDGVAVVIARVDGEPVCTALVLVSDTTAGIYNVATVPEARGRGLGAAVTWAAVMAGRDLGADHAALQSSEVGFPVYRRMGFEEVGRYEQWEGPPV